MTTTSKKNSNLIIKTLRLQSRRGDLADLESYLVELNIHEDIFGNALNGTLVLSDAFNLVRELPIEGTESLMIHVKTFGYESQEEIEIKKDFRVFNITNRVVDYQKGIQVYVLHFCSHEVFKDVLQPLYRPFEGTVSEVAAEIFDEYIATPRYAGGPDSLLVVLDDTNNPVRFISPGWSPFKCMNWLASKAISSGGSAMNYLFWETTKSFYFGSIEEIFRRLRDTGASEGDGFVGVYRFMEKDHPRELLGGDRATMREFFSINVMKMLDVTDHLKLQSDGFLSNMVYTVDLNKKDFFTTVYNHTERFQEYTHSQGESTSTWGSEGDIYTNAENNVYFYPKNTRLFDEFPHNVNEVQHLIFGRRVANLADINNFKLNISISGRTDIQAGHMIYLEWPDTREKIESVWSSPEVDTRYTGFYLITAVRHHITLGDYRCSLEVVKDALNNTLTNGSVSSAFLEGPDESAAETARLSRQAGGE